MTEPSTGAAAVLRLAERGPFRARDLEGLGVPRAYLRRLVDRGLLERAGRGLYAAVDAPATELHSLVEVMARVPNATICLLSALQVHELTTEVPHAVWILIRTHAHAPRLASPTLKVIRAGGAALTHGAETRIVEGQSIRLTSPAKTVADCFRYRRHVGLEVALAALRAYLNPSRKRQGHDAKRFSVDALTEAARADRVSSVIRPYLEALT
jgi:predicted transcriptional regulator of viral defense system